MQKRLDNEFCGKSFAIVLTATIVPNSTYVSWAVPSVRRLEYLKAAKYYSMFGTVYILENSSYDILSDIEFLELTNVHLRKFAPSLHQARGKGYQEFEMIDSWINSETQLPDRWLKISGRYIIDNAAQFIRSCKLEQKYSILIERRVPPAKTARTDVFCCDTNFYRKELLGCFREADDDSGRYIEHVVRRLVKGNRSVATFAISPIISGISGSTGLPLQSGRKARFKFMVRRLFSLVFRRYRIW